MKDPKIIERIKKLMALSLSDNPHEAQLASERLVELMNKYGVTDKDLDNNPFITETFESKKYFRLPKWASELWGNLGYVSGCYVTWSDGYGNQFIGGGRKAKINISGKKTDVEIVRYIGELYEHEIFKKVEEFKKQFKSCRTLTAELNKYKIGLAHGICLRIRKSQKEFFDHHKDDASMALVPVDVRSKEAKAFAELDGKKAVTKGGKDITKDPAYKIGIHDANSVAINKGLNSNTSERLALPTTGGVHGTANV